MDVDSVQVDSIHPEATNVSSSSSSLSSSRCGILDNLSLNHTYQSPSPPVLVDDSLKLCHPKWSSRLPFIHLFSLSFLSTVLPPFPVSLPSFSISFPSLCLVHVLIREHISEQTVVLTFISFYTAFHLSSFNCLLRFPSSSLKGTMNPAY